MKKLLLASVLTLAAVSAKAEEALLLTCADVPSEDIKRIEVFSENLNGAADEVVVYYRNGLTENLIFDSVYLGLESSVPLPSVGKTQRFLENRHTGWAVTSITGGVIGHDHVDCE